MFLRILVIYSNFLLLGLMSCGRPTAHLDNDRSTIFSSQIIDGGLPLDDSSQGIAYRICFALRAKRFHHQNRDGGADINVFHYEQKIKQCNQVESIGSPIELSFSNVNEQLEYNYNSGNLFYGPLTDKQGLLTPICEKVLKGETATNVHSKGEDAYEVHFFSELNTDGVLIKFGKVDSSNEFHFNINLAHYYHVLTDTTISGDYLGVIYKAEEIKNCGNGLLETNTISSLDL